MYIVMTRNINNYPTFPDMVFDNNSGRGFDTYEAAERVKKSAEKYEKTHGYKLYVVKQDDIQK